MPAVDISLFNPQFAHSSYELYSWLIHNAFGDDRKRLLEFNIDNLETLVMDTYKMTKVQYVKILNEIYQDWQDAKLLGRIDSVLVTDNYCEDKLNNVDKTITTMKANMSLDELVEVGEYGDYGLDDSLSNYEDLDSDEETVILEDYMNDTTTAQTGTVSNTNPLIRQAQQATEPATSQITSQIPTQITIRIPRTTDDEENYNYGVTTPDQPIQMPREAPRLLRQNAEIFYPRTLLPEWGGSSTPARRLNFDDIVSSTMDFDMNMPHYYENDIVRTL